MGNISKLLFAGACLFLNIYVEAQKYYDDILKNVPQDCIEVLVLGTTSSGNTYNNVTDSHGKAHKKKPKVKKKYVFKNDEETYFDDEEIVLKPIGDDGLEINEDVDTEQVEESVVQEVPEEETSFNDEETAMNPIDSDGLEVNESVDTEQVEEPVVQEVIEETSFNDEEIAVNPIDSDGLEINEDVDTEQVEEPVVQEVPEETSFNDEETAVNPIDSDGLEINEDVVTESIDETIVAEPKEAALPDFDEKIEIKSSEGDFAPETANTQEIFENEDVTASSMIITSADIERIVSDIILNRKRHDSEFKVALMLPLYLEQVDAEFVSSMPSQKMLLAKPFSFIHFYDGFMLAADSVVRSRGMSLNIKVFDVDQDITKTNNAMRDPWLADADLIVGPFFVRSFEKMRQYAENHNIMIVNPVTPRSSFVENHSNVIKIKPTNNSQTDCLAQLIRNNYYDCNVFIFKMNDDSDSECVADIQRVASENIHPTTKVSNRHIYNVVKRHHNKLKINDLPYSEDEYFTSNRRLDIQYLKSHLEDSTLFENKVFVYSYAKDSLRKMQNFVSNVHRNLVIVYGDDKVFASEIVNKLTKLTEDSEIVLVAMPEWSKFTGLFNENLMKMNAVYFDDDFIDYHNYSILKFICKYRETYGTDPVEYSYLGFNICWYFLNFMMEYGTDFQEHLIDYRIPLLGTDFHFERKNNSDGFENVFWNIYQFSDYEKVKIETEE